jgi:hypothetical protein
MFGFRVASLPQRRIYEIGTGVKRKIFVDQAELSLAARGGENLLSLPLDSVDLRIVN